MAHSLCNLNRSRRKRIPVLAHNAMVSFYEKPYFNCGGNFKNLNSKKYFFLFLQRYDSHMILLALVQLRKEKYPIRYSKILPYNMEQYRAIYIDHFTFLDSYQFLFAGLEKLMNDFSQNTSKENMKIINQCRLAQTNGSMDPLKRDLLLGKGLGKIILKNKYDHVQI